MCWCVRVKSVGDRVLFFIPSLLRAHINNSASSPWVLMEATLSGERNYGKHAMFSSKANRWTYSQWNWVRLYNSWANLHCHLSLLKITWSSRVYWAHSTAQLFGKRLWNPQLSHQRTNKHHGVPVSLSLAPNPPHPRPAKIHLPLQLLGQYLIINIITQKMVEGSDRPQPGYPSFMKWIFGWVIRQGGQKATRKSKQTSKTRNKTEVAV